MLYFFRVAVLVSVVCAPLVTYAADPPSTKIVMLGTGTPRMNPDRSGPATAIVVKDRAYLIDFGPGVVRRAAAAAAKGYPAVDPARIRVAFLTHLHSDHTAGYPDLMLTPWIFGRTELDVYGPQGTEEMTEHLRAAYRQDIEIRTKGMEHRQPLIVRAHDVKPGVVYKDELVTVKAFAVAHGEWSQAFGYRFETPDRTIVISGDTSPSTEVVANCQRCDVLIHEVSHRRTTSKPYRIGQLTGLVITPPPSSLLKSQTRPSRVCWSCITTDPMKQACKRSCDRSSAPIMAKLWLAMIRTFFRGLAVDQACDFNPEF